MKMKLYKSIALLLAAVIIGTFAFPTLAEDHPEHELTEYDQEMLSAFWHQEAYNGLNNGEAVYDIHLPEGGYLFDDTPEYDGGYWTHLISTTMLGNNPVFNFYLYYSLPGWGGTGYGKSIGMKETPLVTVYPDLCGTLDLHGSNLYKLWDDGYSRTHLTDFILDSSTHLIMVHLCNQPAAETFSAMDCKNLYWIDTTGSSFRRLDYTTNLYDDAMHVSSFGAGTVAVLYSSPFFGDVTTLTAAPEKDCFIGWFRNGELISCELECEVNEGGHYAACFGGDADGSGSVTVTDAIIVLRAAMGIGRDGDISPMLDVNGNGVVDVSDAIMILRFAMGII